MRKINGQTYYSPSDLTLFHDSPFASWCEQAYRATNKSFPTPDEEDEFLKLLQQKGYAHEDWLIAHLKSQGRQVVNVEERCQEHDFVARYNVTKELMQDGVEVIFQAALMGEEFAGHADFLVRVDTPSVLGDYSYIVWDTKLSKQPKVAHILQLVAYAKMIAQIQRVLPAEITIVLGDQRFETYQTAEFTAYFESVKSDFIEAKQRFSIEATPEPFESKEYGRWRGFAEGLLAEQRHLSLVANILRSQIKKLNDAGIFKIDELAELEPGGERVSQIKIPSQSLSKLIGQARVQLKTEQNNRPCYELRQPQPGEPELFKGLAPFSLGDIYFDLEGNPLAEDGLEFLWGMTLFDEKGEQTFKALWAHNHTEEKAALAGFFEIVLERWRKYPALKVYHYAHYEITVLRRLTGRYGIYEEEFDNLLRNKVFVDLYRVVKNSLIIGQPSYSIKKVELFYRQQRDTEVGLGGDAVVAYEKWTELGDEKILDAIELYNKDDCDSTYELAEWLRELQSKYAAEIEHANSSDSGSLTHPSDINSDIKNDEYKAIKDSVWELAELQESKSERDALQTLWGLIDFYRREQRPFWWQYFEWLATQDEELYDDRNVIVGCELVDSDIDTKRVRINYNQEQEVVIKTGATFVIKTRDEDAPLIRFKIIEHEREGELLAEVAKKYIPSLPAYFTLLSHDHVPAKILEASILRTVSDTLSARCLNNSALASILRREQPNFTQPLTTLSANRCEQSQRIEEIYQLVSQLDSSYLTIQGPPGTGKTYTASHVIGELFRANSKIKIGISSNSHKALNNLVKAVAEYCDEHDITCHPFVKKPDEELKNVEFTIYETRDLNSIVSDKSANGLLLGGTAWTFAREDVEQAFDYLFVDEAGQVSMAHLAAMSRSTRNIVLLGDQMQLGQPTQGSHPGDAGLSTLDYLMKGQQVVPEDKGVLLSRSYRMHSNVLSFISELVYQGRLDADSANDKQAINISGCERVERSNGIEFHSVEHSGNVIASDEEVEYIESLYRDLIGAEYVDKHEKNNVITTNDILIVTPYNLQVMKLKKTLPEARVGTVDKFQGQEAPIVIFSFCSSAPDESPRGLDFLFDIRRLNVAISRAQALAIVVGSPNLMRAQATTINIMKKASMVNELGRYCV